MAHPFDVGTEFESLVSVVNAPPQTPLKPRRGAQSVVSVLRPTGYAAQMPSLSSAPRMRWLESPSVYPPIIVEPAISV